MVHSSSATRQTFPSKAIRSLQAPRKINDAVWTFKDAVMLNNIVLAMRNVLYMRKDGRKRMSQHVAWRRISVWQRWNDISMSRLSRSGLKFISMQRVTVCKEPGTGEERHLGVKAARWKASAETWDECVWERERERETDTVYLSSNRLTLCGMALFDPTFQSKQSVRAVQNHHALGFCLSVSIWVLNVRREARLACKSVLFHLHP